MISHSKGKKKSWLSDPPNSISIQDYFKLEIQGSTFETGISLDPP